MVLKEQSNEKKAHYITKSNENRKYKLIQNMN